MDRTGEDAVVVGLEVCAVDVEDCVVVRRGPPRALGATSAGCLVAIGALFVTSGAAVAQEGNEYPGQPNPERAQIQLLLSRSGPTLALTQAPDGSGKAIRLDERGLFVDGELVCSWPGGRYDPANAGNMVLGYATVSADGSPHEYTGCRPGLPIVSTWGDCGMGTATLFIEVLSRAGPIVETKYGDQRYYLDLNDLPGDPRVPDSSFEVRLKDFIGWEWQPEGTAGCSLHQDLGSMLHPDSNGIAPRVQ